MLLKHARRGTYSSIIPRRNCVRPIIQHSYSPAVASDVRHYQSLLATLEIYALASYRQISSATHPLAFAATMAAWQLPMVPYSTDIPNVTDESTDAPAITRPPKRTTTWGELPIIEARTSRIKDLARRTSVTIGNRLKFRGSQKPKSLTQQLAFSFMPSSVGPKQRKLQGIFETIIHNSAIIVTFIAVICFSIIVIYYWKKTAELEKKIVNIMTNCNCSALPCHCYSA